MDYRPLPVEQHAAHGRLAAMLRRASHDLKTPEPDAGDIQTLLDLIEGARKPLVLVGGGVIRSKGAVPQFRTFIERLNAPVASTIMGGGAFRGNASPAPTGMFKDGHYKAEQADYHQGYKYYVEITIKNGKISAVDWDAYKENSPLTKKKESEDGTYVMTETGKKWHEQAKIMQDALIAAGDPAKIKYNPEHAKTDAYAGVSVDVSAFVQLANQALDEAKVTKTGTSPRGSAAEIDGVSGATISSKAVVKAANLAYVFVQAVK